MKKIKAFTCVLLALSILTVTVEVVAQTPTGSLITEKATTVDFDERSFYMLVNKSNGKVMDVNDRSIENNANIIAADMDYAMHQVWRMEEKGTGFYNLVNGHSDKVVRDVGSTVEQARDGNSGAHHWGIEHVSGTYFKLTNKNTKNVLSVSGNDVLTASDNGSDAQQWEIVKVSAGAIEPDFSIQGFATVGQGTTGGAGGQVVTVNNAADLIFYMQHANPYIILIDGEITLGPGNHHGSSANMHSISPNKTLFGLPGAKILNGGFNIRGTRNNGVGQVTRTNVIIRNLTFTGGAPDDYINIEEGASNVWIDHNTFVGPNNDGMIDVKREASYVTISWNVLDTNHKTMLCGHDDNHTHDRGYLKVTYHNNHIVNSQSRHPRIRYGRAHLFNNYFENIGDYVMGPGIEAQIISENNHVWTSGRFTDWYHATGRVLERGQGSLINNINHDHDPRIKTSEVDWAPETYYDYKLYPALSVREMVTTYAGAGVISYDDPMPDFYILSTSVEGQGSISPQGGSYNENTLVNVTATAASGWKFDGWSGSITGDENPTSLMMDNNKSITAHFVKVEGGGDNGGGEMVITYDWNFSTMSEYASDFTVSGSRYIAGATLYNSIDVDGMSNRSQDIDGVTYTYNRRVKFGGSGTFSSGTPVSRIFAFDVSGDAKITVVCQSASGTTDRILNVATGPNTVLASAPAPGSSLQMTVVDYTGDARTIYLLSPNSGVNIYHVRVEEPDNGPVTSNMAEITQKEVVDVNYYNLNGVHLGIRLSNHASGIFVKVIRYSDGTFASEKIVMQGR